VNSYGRDITGRSPLFPTLLRSLGEVEGIERIRFTSPHPKDLSSETIKAMAETSAVCNHLHLPLQSGSDRVLTGMRRGYHVERYQRILEEARSTIPDLAVTTDLIVGFPGETDAEFEETLKVVADCSFDLAYTYIFSPREGTRAALMGDEFVPDELVAERFKRLKQVLDRSALSHHEARVGRIEEVLVEGPSRRNDQMISGRTRQGKLIHFPVTTTPMRAGSMASVKVTHGAPYHLLGEEVSLLRGPKHKTRIPLSIS